MTKPTTYGIKLLCAALAVSMGRWAPTPKLNMSDWADENRRLSPEASAEPGRWRTSRAEYQRGMMDAITDPANDIVVMITSAQVGKSEVINNTVGYVIDHDPGPMLLIQPSVEVAQAYSRDRIAPMIRDTACLHDKVFSVKARDKGNTLTYKGFPGGHLSIGGANSPSGLASRPIRYLLCDEVDKYPVSAGTEGDPITLASKRTTTFWNSTEIYVSTPTIAGLSRIEKLYETSDQRHYYVECPHCGGFHMLEWANIIFEHDENYQVIPGSVFHACVHCGALTTDSDLPKMLKNGEWRAHHPEVTGRAGFHLNELYSPWVKWQETVQAFLNSKNDPEMLKVWVNTALGEVWQEAKDISTVDVLMDRRENYDETLLPMGAVILTCGVDVQDDRLEAEVIGWGMDKENWSIEKRVFTGNTSQPDVWALLDDFLRKSYLHESNFRLRIMATGIDTGGHRTSEVYDYCRSRWGRKIFALKGDGGPGKALVSKPSKNNQGNVLLYRVATDTAKDTIAAHLSEEHAGPGYAHFPVGYEEDYFNQLLSERPKTSYSKGRPVRSWQPKRSGIRNEALDCRVYAMAALAILGVDVNASVEQFMKRIQNIHITGTSQTGAKKSRRVRSAGYGGNYARTG